MIEVRGVATSFTVTVWAEQITSALGLFSARYPAAEVRVAFPINPEAFFAGGHSGVPSMIVAQAAEEAVFERV